MNSMPNSSSDDIVNLMKSLPPKQQFKSLPMLNLERAKWSLVVGVVIGCLAAISFQLMHIYFEKYPEPLDLSLFIINIVVFVIIGLAAGGLGALPRSYFLGCVLSGTVLAIGTRIWILLNKVSIFYDAIDGETFWIGNLLFFLLTAWWVIPGSIALRWVAETATEKLNPMANRRTKLEYWLLVITFSLILGFIASSPKFK